MKPSSILVKALQYGGILTIVIAVVGATLGLLVAGLNGVLSALIGTALAAIFMGLSAASILLAGRLSGKESSTLYFGIVLGVWFLKLALFLVLMLFLRGQDWLNPYVFFGAVLAAVIGSLVADGVALQRSRVPYVGDIELPGESKPSVDRPNSAL